MITRLVERLQNVCCPKTRFTWRTCKSGVKVAAFPIGREIDVQEDGIHPGRPRSLLAQTCFSSGSSW
jgi:hypothetical protein